MNGKRTEIFPQICKSTAIFKRLRLCLLYQSTMQQNQTSFRWSGITGFYHCNVGIMFRVVQRDILQSCYFTS